MWVPPVIIHFPWNKLTKPSSSWGIAASPSRIPASLPSFSFTCVARVARPACASRSWLKSASGLEASEPGKHAWNPWVLWLFGGKEKGISGESWRKFVGKVGNLWWMFEGKLEERWRIGIDFRGNMLEVVERLPQLSWDLMGSGYPNWRVRSGKNHQKLDVCRLT